MKHEAPAAAAETDLLKVYIWVIAGVTVLMAAATWYQWSLVQKTSRTIAQGETVLTELAEGKREVRALLKVYSDNNEETARYEPFTWFSRAWKAKGIPDECIEPDAWRDPPPFKNKGRYFEEQIEISFKARNPIARQKIAEFCHEVERASTRLRVLEMNISRKDKDGLTDLWYGKVLVGYRWQKPKGEQ